MNRHVARCLYGVIFAGGLTLLGATAANAADTSGDDGLLSGTLVDSVVSVPVSVGGTAVSLIGDSSTADSVASSAPATASAPVGSSSPSTSSTSGDDGIASGTQVTGVVSVPVTVAGNAISVAGDSVSSGATTDAAAPVTPAAAAPAASTSGDDGIASGTQVAPVISVPVNVGGNAVSVVGDSSSADSSAATGSGFGAVPATTSGDDGIASGTQVAPVISVPVNVGGNAVSVVG
ncbi:hypothetical protein IWX78_000732, partial [Mycetocola sp. CAN_C7]